MPSIKYKKKTYAGATFPVLEMTKAEYDALPEAKKMDGTVYMITDDTGGWEAENSVYDNTQSGLAATNVQDALDEVVAWIDITSNIIYGGIVGNSKNLKAKYNPTLKLLHIYGSFTTNAALAAYSGTNLFQINGNYKPPSGAMSAFNANQNKAHLIMINSSAQFQYADSQAISGAVAFYINYLARIDS